MEDVEILHYARIGAKAELDRILAKFPDILTWKQEATLVGTEMRGFEGITDVPSQSNDQPAKTRKRKGMTPEAKAAVSARMKKYWANRRKAAKK